MDAGAVSLGCRVVSVNDIFDDYRPTAGVHLITGLEFKRKDNADKHPATIMDKRPNGKFQLIGSGGQFALKITAQTLRTAEKSNIATIVKYSG